MDSHLQRSGRALGERVKKFCPGVGGLWGEGLSSFLHVDKIERGQEFLPDFRLHRSPMQAGCLEDVVLQPAPIVRLVADHVSEPVHGELGVGRAQRMTQPKIWRFSHVSSIPAYQISLSSTLRATYKYLPLLAGC